MIGGSGVPDDVNDKVEEIKSKLTIDSAYNLKDIFSKDDKLWSKLKSLRGDKEQ